MSMKESPDNKVAPGTPDISLVMPCYNEEEVVAKTVEQLLAAFEQGGYRLELVVVNNGSNDRTGDILQRIARTDANVIYHHVEINKGYGYGVRQGLPLCTAPWVGIIVADGQVDPVDVVKLFDVAGQGKGPRLLKVRRRFRMDGFKRKVVSILYNLLTTAMFGGLHSIDINGSPKILPRRYLERMNLTSDDWFLDAEIMIKAKRLGLGVFEQNVLAQMRPGGSSNVNAGTCGEFIVNLLRYRFGGAGKISRRPVDAVESENPSYIGR